MVKIEPSGSGGENESEYADTSECACSEYQRWYQPRPQESLLCNLVLRGRDPFGQRQGGA